MATSNLQVYMQLTSAPGDLYTRLVKCVLHFVNHITSVCYAAVCVISYDNEKKIAQKGRLVRE